MGTKGLTGENYYHTEKAESAKTFKTKMLDLHISGVCVCVCIILLQLLFHPAIICMCVCDYIVCSVLT